MRHLSLLLGVTGCAQIFGLDTTSSPDADPSKLTVQVQRAQIGATVTRNPLDLSGQTGSFLIDDGVGGFSKLPAQVVLPDTFSGDLTTGLAPALFTLPDEPTPYLHLLSTPSRNQRSNFVVFEHPNPQPRVTTSQLMIAATLPSPYVSSESFRIEAIGAWGAYGLVAGNLPAPDLGATTISTLIPYSSFSPMVGKPPTRITSADVVVIERYVGERLTAIYQVPSFDQSEATDVIQATITAVPANEPLSMKVTPAIYAQRYSAVRPAVTVGAMNWIVTAAPGFSLGSLVGPQLNAAAIAATDADINTMYPQPFGSLGWNAVLRVLTRATRSYTFSGVATTLSAQMFTVAEPSGTMTMDLPAGLPINLRANLMPLTTDGMSIALDLTKAVEIDAQTDRTDNTVYVLTLVELTLSADMLSVQRRIVVEAFTTGEPKFRLPPELFEVDHSYYVNFRSYKGGYTAAASGDLQTFTLPYSVSSADSAVFKVVAP